jgi:hypothetical protein
VRPFRWDEVVLHAPKAMCCPSGPHARRLFLPLGLQLIGVNHIEER